MDDYRCRVASTDYASTPDGHPPTLAIREDRILPALDRWLVELFAPERIADVVAAVVEADAAANADHPAVRQARRTIATARRKIERHLAALEAGVDPALIAEPTKQAQDDIAKAQAIIDNAPDTPEPLTRDEVLAALSALRELPELLDDADTELRADVFRSLGIELNYRRENGVEYIQVQASIKSVDLERVGGGT